MVSYVLTPDEVRPPPFVGGTEDALATPRPNTQLVAVVAPRSNANFPTTGMRDDTEVYHARHSVLPGCYHVVSDPGYQHVVMGGDVSWQGGPADFRPYRVVDEAPPVDDDIMQVFASVWDDTPKLKFVSLVRQLPAFVLGQLPPAGGFDEGWIITPSGMWWTLPGAWVIRDFSGHDVRVVPETHTREFAGVTLRTPLRRLFSWPAKGAKA